jgi:4-aminobutyrate aminotransferase
MNRMMERYKIVGAVRGLGLLMGIELVKDKETKEPATDAAEEVMYKALGKGLSFKVTMGNIITLTPPLTITKQEMDKALDILDECLKDVAKA